MGGRSRAGYDVGEMTRRGRGRPDRGAEPMQGVAVRLTAEDLTAVDAIAEHERICRSGAIRRALDGFGARRYAGRVGGRRELVDVKEGHNDP